MLGGEGAGEGTGKRAEALGGATVAPDAECVIVAPGTKG